jgi:hypothetical protein
MSKTPSRVDRLREMREAKFAKKPVPKTPLPPADPFPDHPAHDKPIIADASEQMAGEEVEAAMRPGKQPNIRRTDRVQLNVTIPREMMKELKIDAVETDQTIEAWVEAAIRQELKARVS